MDGAMKTSCRFCLLAALIAGFYATPVTADDAESEGELERTVTVGKFHLTAPEAWTRRKPKSQIVEFEFAAPASEGDEADGRVTLMSAGGTVKENVKRWRDQFPVINDEDEKDLKIAGQKVVWVSLTGTYNDKQGGPFAPGVERDGYRMLGAIIQMKGGNYFVKFVGPQKTVTDHEENFKGFLDSLSQK
jgi:hypothetical protein